MRFVNVLFIALTAFVLLAVGYLYVQNLQILSTDITLWGGYQIKVSSLLIGVFLLGFFLNLLYTGVMELRRAIQGLNASAANRLGKRISERMDDARELVAHGLDTQAKPILEGILEQRENHIPATLALCELLLRGGEASEALKRLEALREIHPDLIEARYLLADALQGCRDQEGALGVLKKIASDHPKQALRASRRLRALHMDAQRWEEALDVHKKILAQFPSEISNAEKGQGLALNYQAGLQKVESDQFKDAAQIFQQVLKDDKDFVPAYLSLGRCMILQDQEAQGIEIWLEGFRATGEGTFLQEIEDYFIQLGKPEEGLAVLRRVAATSKHPTTAKFFLGKMLYRLEILDEALELFQEVRSQVVYSPVLFFFMAKIHSRRGRSEAALNEYRQLLRNLGVLRLRFECAVCNHKTADYADRCENCGSWNSSHFLFKESDLPDDGPLRPETGSWLNLA
jgi:lipopolysaccharide biosynthesis regulator YciM